MSMTTLVEREIFIKEETVPKRGPIYNPWDLAENLIILGRGCVMLYRQTATGQRVVLDILSSGSIFGHEALAENHQDQYYKDSAQALVECTISKIPSRYIPELVQTNPGLTADILKQSARRILSLGQRIEDLVTKPVSKRLAIALIYLSPIPELNNNCLLGFTDEALAYIVGSTRETIAREISKLKKEGIVDKRGRQPITILDYSKLKGIASGDNIHSAV